MNQCMTGRHCMAHICAIDLIVMPYFHLKHCRTIHGNLNNKINSLQGSHWVTNCSHLIHIGVFCPI